MAKQPAPARSYELEAADVLATVMRQKKGTARLFAAAALLIAAALSRNGNGNGNGKH